MINFKPTECNLYGGQVKFTSNAEIYGKEQGSGKCYLCLNCGAYVGTHQPRSDEAFGILADYEMRKWKIKCHELFDKLWQSEAQDEKRNQRYFRSMYYGMLAEALGIEKAVCHFGYFDMAMLKRAYEILSSQKLAVKGKRVKQETNFDYYSKTPERMAELTLVHDSLCSHCAYECENQQPGMNCAAGIASWLKRTREEIAA